MILCRFAVAVVVVFAFAVFAFAVFAVFAFAVVFVAVFDSQGLQVWKTFVLFIIQ